MALIFNTYTVSITDPVLYTSQHVIKMQKLNIIESHTIFSSHIGVSSDLTIT